MKIEFNGEVPKDIKLEPDHVYRIKNKHSDEESILFVAQETTALRVMDGTNKIGFGDKEYFESSYRILADITDSIKIIVGREEK